MRTLGLAASVVFAMLCCRPESARPVPRGGGPRRVIPAFADLAGVRVGYDTIQELEKRLGPGRAVTGGHPQGARVWRVTGRGWTLYADGFNSYARSGVEHAGGRVIDELWISREGWRGTVPRARLSSRELRFMGVVSLGMPAREVIARLKRRLPAPKREGTRLKWSARGFNRLNANRFDDKHNWEATLEFKRGVLDSIVIGSD